MTIDLKAIAGKRLELGARFVATTLDRVESARADFGVYAKANNIPGEVLADDYADMESYHVELSEMLIEWAYHWAEREMKLLLARHLGKTLKQVASFSDLETLTRAYASAGIDLTVCADWATVGLARVFANAWKHQPLGKPSAPLLKALGIDPAAHTGLGLLADSAIRDAMSQTLSGSPSLTEVEIAKRIAEGTRAFLLDVLARCRF